MDAHRMLTENAQGHCYHDSTADVLDRKWAWLNEGIENKWERRVMSRMYENQMAHLRDEAGKKGFLFEATAASAIPEYVKFVFPMIRRVWANLFANGLVSVQPMNAPVGGVFFWEYKYGSSKGSISAGDNMIENFDRFYTSERVWNEQIGTGTGGVAAYGGTLDWFPIKPYSSFGQAGIEFVSVAGGASKRIYDSDGSGTLAGDFGAASTLNFNTGVYAITFDANIDAGQPVYANYFFNMEASSSNVPEVNIDISLQPVQAWSRKIKALWSAESADDLRAMLGLDIESELVGGLASEVALEIDREIVMDLYVAAGQGTNTDTFNASVPAATSAVEWYSGIMTKFDKLATEIHKRTKRGPGNWIVCSTDVATVVSALSRHGDFKGVFDQAQHLEPGMGTGGRPNFPLPAAPQGYGIYTAGTLQNRWRVIVDPYFPAGKALVGLKGPSFLDGGYAYAPYVPLQVTSTFLDPSNFQARKGLRTRYATKLLNSNFYGLLNVTNTP